jgi:hypothetical protein
MKNWVSKDHNVVAVELLWFLTASVSCACSYTRAPKEDAVSSLGMEFKFILPKRFLTSHFVSYH